MTGLFNSRSELPTPINKPDCIGIGVELYQKKDIFSESRPMWSFIADTNGSPLYKIQIDSTKNSNFDNMFVGIYPMSVSYTHLTLRTSDLV